MIHVTVLENYAAAAVARLRTHSKLHVMSAVRAAADVALDDTHILLVRSHTQVNKALLDRAPQLQLIVTATSGFDHIDWRECRRRGVVVAHTPDANAQSTAELTLTLLLAWERQLLAAQKNVSQGLWREGLGRPSGLTGRTLGIVGFGRVGRYVARMAQVFNMHVIAYDPYVETHVERFGLIELLRASDYVSLHVPLTRETLHLLNHATLKEMQADAVLINTCRGPVVNESDLLTALDEGTIKGAAMDVVEREPPPRGHRILSHPKALLTPHIGAYTDDAWNKASHEAVDKVLHHVDGRVISDTLPLDVPWFDKT